MTTYGMIKKYQVALLAIIFGAVCVTGGMYYARYTQKLPEPIIQNIEVKIPVYKPYPVHHYHVLEQEVYPFPNSFRSGEEFKAELDKLCKGIIVLANHSCPDVALGIVQAAWEDGYHCETEIIDSYPKSHVVIKTFIPDKKQVWLYNPVTGRCWLGYGEEDTEASQ